MNAYIVVGAKIGSTEDATEDTRDDTVYLNRDRADAEAVRRNSSVDAYFQTYLWSAEEYELDFTLDDLDRLAGDGMTQIGTYIFQECNINIEAYDVSIEEIAEALVKLLPPIEGPDNLVVQNRHFNIIRVNDELVAEEVLPS